MSCHSLQSRTGAIGDRARLFRDVVPRRGHWMQVRAWDSALRRDAYGAEVRVQAGGREWLRVVNPAQSYLCSGDVLACFGLASSERTSIALGMAKSLRLHRKTFSLHMSPRPEMPAHDERAGKEHTDRDNGSVTA